MLARVRLLSGECREALERLSVLTSTIPTDLADALGALEPLAEAEMAGLIELREDGLGFRHELARRAIEQSLPEIRRRLLNQRVVAALRERGRPDRGRLLHHAAEAGDVDTLLAEGPAAAREAARAGSHRQALAHFEAVVPHAARLDARECAALLDDYGWELYNAHQFRAAVEAAHEAERLYREVGELVPLGAVPGAALAPPVHGRRDRRGRGGRAARGGRRSTAPTTRPRWPTPRSTWARSWP